MQKKINVAVIFGGKSVEHEVSLQSARNVIHALDKNKYNPILMGIDKDGKWHFFEESDYLLDEEDPKAIALGAKKGEVELLEIAEKKSVDVGFPVLHGLYGEDGTVQGLLKLANIPYVGADVLGSAIGMDKDVMKRLIRDAGIPTPKFITIHRHQKHLWPCEKIKTFFPFPFFVKPSNSGSSIGINKIHSVSEFDEMVDYAFQFDRKIIIEETISGFEIQCGLIGNEYPIVSLPCQIIPKGEFHSYASKYLDPDGAEFIIPANLSSEELTLVQTLSLQAYRVLCCEGMARVDLFLTKEGKVYFSEINTIPGLTKLSPFSKMWEATGISYSEMLDRVIQLAIDRHRKEEQLISQIATNQICAEHTEVTG